MYTQKNKQTAKMAYKRIKYNSCETASQLTDNRKENSIQRKLKKAMNRSKFSKTIIQMRSRAKDADSISKHIKKNYKIFAGNRSEDIISTGGKSYAGFALLDYLYKTEATGNFGDYENRKKRATLAYDLKAANCDQFGDLSYCIARQDTDAENIAVETKPGHTYAVMFDHEDKDKPEDQSIIDPWVNRGGLRKNQGGWYDNGFTQYNTIKADKAKWYMPGFTDSLKQKYKLDLDDDIYNRNASIGLDLAKKKREGQSIAGMY